MDKNIFSYFDCGHAALSLAGSTEFILYRLPPSLSLTEIDDYIKTRTVETLRGKIQIVAHGKEFCGVCSPYDPVKLLDTLNASLEEHGLEVSPAELVQQARDQLQKQNFSTALIDKMVPPGFVYQPK